MKNRNNIKILAVLTCLSFTCFLTQCQACQKKDPVTEKFLPNQIAYSISCGFPAPWFDVNILTSAEKEFHYAVDTPYSIPISAAVNIIAVALMYVLMKFLVFKRLVVPNRFLTITLALAVLFSLGLLAPCLPEFVITLFVYAYIYPVGYIGSFFEYMKIALPDNNLPPRIYLVILLVSLYLFSTLLMYARSRYKARAGNV